MDFCKAKILCDSINPVTGARLTSFEFTFPRIILSEWNTHRVFSRNAASSRAVPLKVMRERVRHETFQPIHWGKNQKGMQADEELTGEALAEAKQIWMDACEDALKHHERLEAAGVHKQIANRIIEPYMYINNITTATDFNNFFKLRAHKDAQPEIQRIAHMAHELYKFSTPKILNPGEWHIPYIFDDEREMDIVKQVRISSGRCARVSYFYHDGKRSQWEQDIDICKRLMVSEPQHASPFEHQAMAADINMESGNFRGGWIQHRKFVEAGVEPYAKWD